MYGSNLSPIVIAIPSIADFKRVICPFKLSNIVAAISSAVPLAPLIATVNLSKSVALAFTIVNNPDIASLPAKVVAYAAFSVSVNPANDDRKFVITSAKLFILPLLSVKLMPNFSIATACASVGFAIFAITFFKVVPAVLPLIPAFAIMPIATEISSTLYPIAPAVAAQYLKLSPIKLTFVFAFVDAAAITSAKRPLSFAAIPNAVKPSVTISEVVPKFSPAAAARFIIPAMPSTISAVFHPAIAIYFIASALSLAEKAVAAPISLALFVNISISAAVAPEIAPTSDIALSKSAAVFTAAVATPAIGRVIAVVRVDPTFEMVFPAFWICLPAFTASFPIFFILSITAFEGFVKPSINCIAALITLPITIHLPTFYLFVRLFRLCLPVPAAYIPLLFAFDLPAGSYIQKVSNF